MSTNTHFTVALHILTWIALASQQQETITSDRIAESVNTNPVFIRRILGRLHTAHLVNVQHGLRAGWTLARPPEEISLQQVYQAIQQQPFFELHHTLPNQICPVGRGIQPALKHFYSDAEMALKQQLAGVSVAHVLQETLTSAAQAASKGVSSESSQPEPA